MNIPAVWVTVDIKWKVIMKKNIYLTICLSILFSSSFLMAQERKEPQNKIISSPFGIYGPFIGKINRDKQSVDLGYIKYLTEINTAWVRITPPALSSNSETLNKNGINILCGMARPRFPRNIEQYKERTEQLVRKFKSNVDAWLIVNEADFSWRDTPEKFVEYFAINAEIVRREDPTAQIVFGLAGDYELVGKVSNKTKGERVSPLTKNFLDAVLKNGLGQYFDVLDFHHQGEHDEYTDISEKIGGFNKILAQYGVKNKDYWITELGTNDGDPDEDRGRLSADLPYQSEKTHAAGLVKAHVYALAHGVKKMFWSHLEERGFINNKTNTYYNTIGLINNPSIDGQSHKKLAYYAYKMMADILTDADWKNITIVRESDGIFIYRFIKDDKSIWVLWNENKKEQSITLSLNKDIEGIQIIEAVPNYQSGKEVVDYNTSFKKIDANIFERHPMKAKIQLNEVPIFVQEK